MYVYSSQNILQDQRGQEEDAEYMIPDPSNTNQNILQDQGGQEEDAAYILPDPSHTTNTLHHNYANEFVNPNDPDYMPLANERSEPTVPSVYEPLNTDP